MLFPLMASLFHLCALFLMISPRHVFILSTIMVVVLMLETALLPVKHYTFVKSWNAYLENIILHLQLTSAAIRSDKPYCYWKSNTISVSLETEFSNRTNSDNHKFSTLLCVLNYTVFVHTLAKEGALSTSPLFLLFQSCFILKLLAVIYLRTLVAWMGMVCNILDQCASVTIRYGNMCSTWRKRLHMALLRFMSESAYILATSNLWKHGPEGRRVYSR